MEELTRVVSAVRHDDEMRAELWFATLHDAYRRPDEADPAADWDVFAVRLQQLAAERGFPSETVGQFCENLRHWSSEPLSDVVAVRQLWQTSGDEVLAAYREVMAEPDEPAHDEHAHHEQPYDGQAHEEPAHEQAYEEPAHEQAYDEAYDGQAHEQAHEEPAHEEPGHEPAHEQHVEQHGGQHVEQHVEHGHDGHEQQPEADVSTFPKLQEGSTGEWVDYAATLLEQQGYLTKSGG